MLYDGGPNQFAVGFGRWDERDVVVTRWNGDDKDRVIGNPQSRGLATWFVLPGWLAVATLQALLARHDAGDPGDRRPALDHALVRFKAP